ncbi:MAG: hypothetical protein HY581_06820 [Nitrospirae bacterium]|nr:hypothetical protein [Nitrospirota bacterium]
MQLKPFQGGVVTGLLLATFLVGIGLFVGQGLLKSERDAYERGAWIAVIHSQCRGNFPSPAYLSKAFKWGDPKTCDEVQKINEMK